MSTFDPATFLHSTVEESNSTETVPVPEGEYLAICDKADVQTWQKKDGSESGLKIQLIWDIQDEAVKELLDRQKVTVRQDQMLDLTDAGALDMGKGKNVGLGRLRSAMDLNEPGQPFSIAMFQGRMAKVLVKHRPAPDGVTIYSEVRGVAHP